MEFKFSSRVVEWRGPAPFYFSTTPPEVTKRIETSAGHLSYGWGCIPVDVTIGRTTFYTALIPREGTYFVPLKAKVRKSESIELGQQINLMLKFAE
ncbi:MAG: hypothetical protein RL140_43 [Actinomycetota bacterium]|jgi:hypothetical protein